MKKTLLSLTVIAAAISSFAQGDFYFNPPASTLWETNGSGTWVKATPNSLETSFLIGSGTSPLESIAAGTGTNAGTATFITTAQDTAAWNDILNSTGGFILATNNGTSALVTQLNGANGSITYNGGASFYVTGSTASAATSVVLISWPAAYATPVLAAAAGAPLGWSQEFSYTPQSGVTAPASMTSSLVGNFGLVEITATPEPSTIALAGLGVSALVAFRRRNSSK